MGLINNFTFIFNAYRGIFRSIPPGFNKAFSISASNDYQGNAFANRSSVMQVTEDLKPLPYHELQTYHPLYHK